MLDTSRAVMTASSSTSQKSAILRFMSSSSGRSVRQSSTSGWMPIDRRSRTLCCVGFVFSSPADGDVRHERQVDVERVLAADVLAELADGLEERQALDVADRAADLDEQHVDVLRPPTGCCP